jgi:hypothetical protein
VDEFWGGLFLLAFVLGYILLCRWIGEYANRKGYSYWGVALFSLFFTPVWGGILALLVPERKGPNRVPLRNKPT